MKIAMLLQGTIANDHRVIKMINTLCKEHEIDLFCLADTQNIRPQELRPEANVFFVQHAVNLKTLFLRHSFFCFEFNHFTKTVLKQKTDYDIVWANDLPMLYPAHSLARRLNAKVVYDSHEIYIETLNQFFPEKSSLVKGIVLKILLNFMKFHGERVERKWISKSFLITVNHSLLSYFIQKYEVAKGKVIMNLPKLSELRAEMMNYREMFSYSEEDFIMLYQGNLNQGRGLNLLIDVMTKLPSKYKLVFIGDGPLKNGLELNVIELKLEKRVHFLPLVAVEELVHYTKGADLGINLLEPINLSKKLASPNKLFEYIHAEITVLASAGYENQIIIDQFEVGIAVKMHVDDIVKEILDLNSNSLNQYKINCSKAKHQLKWQNQEPEILQIPNLVIPAREKS